MSTVEVELDELLEAQHRCSIVSSEIIHARYAHDTASEERLTKQLGEARERYGRLYRNFIARHG